MRLVARGLRHDLLRALAQLPGLFLLVGLLCAVDLRAVHWSLVALALVGGKSFVKGAVNAWRERSDEPGLMGTRIPGFAPRRSVSWRTSFAWREGRPLFFVTTGYPEGLIPGISTSPSWFLVPGVRSPPSRRPSRERLARRPWSSCPRLRCSTPWAARNGSAPRWWGTPSRSKGSCSPCP